jgi:hypothetical protein
MLKNKTPHKFLISITLLLVVVGIWVLFFGLPWGLQALTVFQLEKISGQKIHLKEVSIQYFDRAITLTGVRMVDRNSSPANGDY